MEEEKKAYKLKQRRSLFTMNTSALNGLWEYLQTLSLTNKNRLWLAEHLVNANAAEKKQNGLDLAIEDEKAGRVISYNSLEELIKDI